MGSMSWAIVPGIMDNAKLAAMVEQGVEGAGVSRAGI